MQSECEVIMRSIFGNQLSPALEASKWADALNVSRSLDNFWKDICNKISYKFLICKFLLYIVEATLTIYCIQNKVRIVI